MKDIQKAIKYYHELSVMHDSIDKYHTRLLELWKSDEIFSDLEMDEINDKLNYVLRELEFSCLKFKNIMDKDKLKKC
jgi:hypothetical protein